MSLSFQVVYFKKSYVFRFFPYFLLTVGVMLNLKLPSSANCTARTARPSSRPVVSCCATTRRDAAFTLLGFPLLAAAPAAKAQDFQKAKEERENRKRMLEAQVQRSKETGKGGDAFPTPDYSVPMEALSQRGAP
ncbi:hypothetical protein DUNSADRAFT_71 [Dunaliella salina]|uniref:Encoded protein n=1 Tax=Dunaliella salina TaxID=3046 RepID=A0ABQ7H8T7_DUNSA|nr:hypothetical protein DUNSADRAFT_71 [Dunaliella salina]|eukprot:KAF5843269.1 hypothetical protein DUNSADRAFT_71 [Dunaliella salina]